MKSKSELRFMQEQMKQKRQFEVNHNLEAFEISEIKKNAYLHGLLHSLTKLMRYMNKCSGDFPDKKYFSNLYKEHPEYIGRPIIVAPTHVRKEDIETIMEACPLHMVLLSGDFENVKNDIAGLFLEKNGIIYFDMEKEPLNGDLEKSKKYIDELNIYLKDNDDPIIKAELVNELINYKQQKANFINDRKNVKHTINNVLSNGFNMLWFYEGSWNMSQNKPYYDGNYYMVEAAIDNNALVLPVSFDMIEEDKSKTAVVRFGDIIDYGKLYGNRKLSPEEKKDALDILKGQLGKGLFDIWEKYSKVKRDDIILKYGTVQAYYEEYCKRVLSKWNFTMEDLDRKHFKDKDIVTKEEAFSHLDNLELNKNNSFLFSKRNHH